MPSIFVGLGRTGDSSWPALMLGAARKSPAGWESRGRHARDWTAAPNRHAVRQATVESHRVVRLIPAPLVVYLGWGIDEAALSRLCRRCSESSRSAVEKFAGVAGSVEPALLAMFGFPSQADRRPRSAVEQATEVAYQRQPALGGDVQTLQNVWQVSRDAALFAGSQ
jgi:hypothetical protein